MSFLTGKVNSMMRMSKCTSTICILSRRSVLENFQYKNASQSLERQYSVLRCRKMTQYDTHVSSLILPNFCTRVPGVTMTTRPYSQIDPFTKQPFKHPTKGDLVYGGPLSKMVKKVKIFSLATSVIGVSLQPYIYLNSAASIKVLFAVGGFLNFFVFLTPVLIHMATKRYVTDIFYKEDERKFSVASISFLLRRKELEFTPADVVVPTVSGMFTSHVIKGRPYLIQSDAFTKPQAYVDMMGYDKPLDISVKPIDVKNK